MAKLNQKNAKAAADKADDWGDRVLEHGIYLVKLLEVDTSRSGPAGPYWSWKVSTVGAGEEPVDRFVWDNTSLSESAIGRLGKVFAAFGVGTDTDTDDMINKLAAVEVVIGTVSQGPNAGNRRNNIANWYPADTHPHYEDYLASVGAGNTPGSAAFDEPF